MPAGPLLGGRLSSVTVRRASRELRELGLEVMPLHEAIGLEHAPRAEVAAQPGPLSARRAAREGAEGPRMMSVGLHCRLAGRPGRAAALERFLRHVRAHPDEVCPAKWEEGEETLAPSLQLVGKI